MNGYECNQAINMCLNRQFKFAKQPSGTLGLSHMWMASGAELALVVKAMLYFKKANI